MKETKTLKSPFENLELNALFEREMRYQNQDNCVLKVKNNLKKDDNPKNIFLNCFGFTAFFSGFQGILYLLT